MNISDYTREFGTTWCNYPTTVIMCRDQNGQTLSLGVTIYVQDGVLDCNFTIRHGERVVHNTKNYGVAMFYYTEFDENDQ